MKGHENKLSSHAYHFFGGNGVPLHMAVANGFPPHTYEPMLSTFLHKYQAFSALPRALWEPPPALDSAPDWHTAGDDLLAGLHRLGHSGVIGVGHSMGGVATMLAAVKEPSLFRGIVMLDPVILPPFALWAVAITRPFGFSFVPLSKKALKRRRHFNALDEAFAYWRKKRLFEDWSDDVLQKYTSGLLVEDAENDGYRLQWEPEWEAHYYDSVPTNTWRYLRKLPKDLPALIIRGEKSDTLFPSAVKRIQRLVPHVEIVTIEGYGHLFPQAAPEQTADLVRNWMTKHGWNRT